MKKLLASVFILLSLSCFAQQVTTTGPPHLRIMSGDRQPNGFIVGYPGELYLEGTGTVGKLWQKLSGINTNTGWKEKIDSIQIPCPQVDLCLGISNIGDTASFLNQRGQFVKIIETDDWSILGNSGTNSSVNFVGNIDDVDLVFRVNNHFSGLLDRDASNTSFGYNANAVASSNTSFGANSLSNNISGNGNVSVGQDALLNDTTGNDNTAIGNGSQLFNRNGSFVTTLGYGSDVINASLSYSTAIGQHALIGHSYCGVLGDTTVPYFWGVGTSYPDSLLHHNNGFGIVGHFALKDGTQGASKILTSDANGLASWQKLFGNPTKDSIATSGDTITFAINSSYVVTSSGTVTSVTASFPSGNTGDWILVVYNVAVNTQTNIGTGSGTADLSNPRIGQSKIYINIGGNWY